LTLGWSEASIDQWMRRGRIHRIHAGVYAVGHTAITVRGRWMAAVLASGDGAVLSHNLRDGALGDLGERDWGRTRDVAPKNAVAAVDPATLCRVAGG
jgi:hypothetical protein